MSSDIRLILRSSSIPNSDVIEHRRTVLFRTDIYTDNTLGDRRFKSPAYRDSYPADGSYEHICERRVSSHCANPYRNPLIYRPHIRGILNNIQMSKFEGTIKLSSESLASSIRH